MTSIKDRIPAVWNLLLLNNTAVSATSITSAVTGEWRNHAAIYSYSFYFFFIIIFIYYLIIIINLLFNYYY